MCRILQFTTKLVFISVLSECVAQILAQILSRKTEYNFVIAYNTSQEPPAAIRNRRSAIIANNINDYVLICDSCICLSAI